jgi:hypothetical protein
MKLFRLLLICCIVSLGARVALAAAPGGAAAAVAFTYTAFPELPSTTVASDNYVANLLAACQKLVEASQTGASLSAPQVCAPAPAAMPASLQSDLQQAQSLPEKAPAPPARAPGQAGAKPAAAPAGCAAAESAAQTSANNVAKATGALQTACLKLYVAMPQPNLNQQDVQALTDARDAPDFLPAVIAWTDAVVDATKNQKPALHALQEALKGAQGAGQGAPLVASSSLGALSDQFIRGMAEFLQKRAQAEALRYLRIKLKSELCDRQDQYAQVRKAIFSNVCVALGSLDDGMSLEAIGVYLRAAAEKDLRKLPDLSLAYLEQRQPQAANATFSGRLGLAYYAAARGGRDPFEILYSLAELNLQDCESKNTCSEVSKAVRVASVVAYALRQGGSNWQDLFGDALTAEGRPVAAVAILLLADKRAASAAVQGVAWFKATPKVLNSVVLNPLAFVNQALSMARTWKALSDRLKSNNLTDEARREVLADAMEQGIGSLTRMVEDLDRIVQGKASPRITRAVERARDFSAIASNLVRRNYGASIVMTLEQVKDLAPNVEQHALFGKYLPLVVEIATAQSSNDVAAAIDAAAAPLASYELKFKQPMLALNGIVGLTYNLEHMSSKGVSGDLQSMAAFAPIGLHLSTNFSDNVHGGLLFSVLDLGAVTSFKTAGEPEGTLEGVDAETATEKPKASDTPQIRFEQVFSPGVYAVFGFCQSPFVVGFGASLAPALREVRQDRLVEQVSVMRYGLFAGIDIPILPFSLKK